MTLLTFFNFMHVLLTVAVDLSPQKKVSPLFLQLIYAIYFAKYMSHDNLVA